VGDTGSIRLEGPPIEGVTGYTQKPQMRVDFSPSWFDENIDNHGARLAWARAIRCPCAPVNKQTQQSDPTCPRCKSTPGWMYFGPRNYEIPESFGDLDQVQRAIMAEFGAAGIRGLLHGITNQVEAYSKLGEWTFGTSMVTVRPDNRLSYYDRLVDLDSEVTFSQVFPIVSAGRGTNLTITPPPLRYRPIAVNIAIGQDGRTFHQLEDFELTIDGVVRWYPGRAPASGYRVAYHYLHHTVWRVIEWPHALRRTQPGSAKGLKKAKLKTPLGEPQSLPIQALLRLDHLIDGAVSGA
jgi:hypothetical protein